MSYHRRGLTLFTHPAGPKSEETIRLQNKIKNALEDQIWDFFTVQGGQVVIYDANNGSIDSRKEVIDTFRTKGVHVIFLGAFKP